MQERQCRDLNIGDWSLFLFDYAVEGSDYVLIAYSVGKLAHLSELQFLPHPISQKG